MSDFSLGLLFMRKNKGTYDIVLEKGNNGDFCMNLIKHNPDDSISVVRRLDMTEIYEQCAPKRIIDRLERDMSNTRDLIDEVKSDGEEYLIDTDVLPF